MAANAQFVMTALQKEFTRQSGIPLETVINSSGKLTTQIQQGAPFDLFLSADMDFPEKLYAGGLTTEKPRIYAYGTLVLWTMGTLDLTGGLNSLLASTVQKIAVANTGIAPYGRAAVEALQTAKLYDRVQPKLVFGESIAQVNQYVQAGVVEVGFTAKSVVLAPALTQKGHWADVPLTLYKPIAQGVVVLKSAKNGPAARRFMNFLFTPIARSIFRQYGYLLK